MHDPSTVAFEIRYPWRAYRSPRNEWERSYRAPLITIWHEDPLKFEGKCGCRDDDSCGWHTPPYSPADRERVLKLAERQYSQIFEKQVRTAEGASYANICNEPDCHSAIYWAWRAIKQEFHPRGPWQYGAGLTETERAAIYELATCPVDNLQSLFRNVKDKESFEGLFFCVYRAFIRFRRPWYRHPRWHFWHWRFQVHPWQTFRRWAFSRCAGCGKRFSWGYCPTSHSWHSPKPKLFQGEVGVYHTECSHMTTALERTPPAGVA